MVAILILIGLLGIVPPGTSLQTEGRPPVPGRCVFELDEDVPPADEATGHPRPSCPIRIVGSASTFNSPCWIQSYEGCRILDGVLTGVDGQPVSLSFAIEREFEAGPCAWRTANIPDERDAPAAAGAFVRDATRFLNGNRRALHGYRINPALLWVLASNRHPSCR